MCYPVLLRDHFVKSPSQWETTLHCNVVFHWLGKSTKWPLESIKSRRCNHQGVLENSTGRIGQSDAAMANAWLDRRRHNSTILKSVESDWISMSGLSLQAKISSAEPFFRTSSQQHFRRIMPSLSWLVAELILITWPKTISLIGRNKLFNYCHDRIEGKHNLKCDIQREMLAHTPCPIVQSWQSGLNSAIMKIIV